MELRGVMHAMINFHQKRMLFLCHFALRPCILCTLAIMDTEKAYKTHSREEVWAVKH